MIRNYKFFSIRTLMIILVIVLLASIFYSFNAESILGDKMPMPVGYTCSVVLSGSMEPEISVNDLVVIKKTKDLKVGDVVVFQKNYSLTIHRIIKINGDVITTKGDANNVADEPINIKDIKGVMVGKIPYIGAIVRLLKQPLVVAILLILSLIMAKFSYGYDDEDEDNDGNDLQAIKREIEELKKKL